MTGLNATSLMPPLVGYFPSASATRRHPDRTRFDHRAGMQRGRQGGAACMLAWLNAKCHLQLARHQYRCTSPQPHTRPVIAATSSTCIVHLQEVKHLERPMGITLQESQFKASDDVPPSPSHPSSTLTHAPRAPRCCNTANPASLCCNGVTPAGGKASCAADGHHGRGGVWRQRGGQPDFRTQARGGGEGGWVGACAAQGRFGETAGGRRRYCHVFKANFEQ